MLTEPLPRTLDVRKAAARQVTAEGVVALTELPRLRGMLASDEGYVEARCEFERDEENRFVANVVVSAEVEVECQRCLEPMKIALRTRTRLAVVGSDEAARQLPASLEPWVLEEEAGDLWSLVEDELILEIPAVAVHDTASCERTMDPFRDAPAETAASADSPFKVLEQLDFGTTKQEK